MRARARVMTGWSPLAGGFLSGKYTRENLKDSENRLASFDFLPFDKEAGFSVVEKMREIAARHDASVAQIAIACCWPNRSFLASLSGRASPINSKTT